MTKYKTPLLQQTYDKVLAAGLNGNKALFTPDGRQRRGSSQACAFWDGYNGIKSVIAIPGTLSGACWQAGKEFKRRSGANVKRTVGKPAAADPAKVRSVRLNDTRWAKFQTLGREWLEAAIDDA